MCFYCLNHNSIIKDLKLCIYECESLVQESIHSSITAIKSSTFEQYRKLIETSIPSSVAFYFCSSLTQISIPSSVTENKKSTFIGCSSSPLTEVSIPSSFKDDLDYIGIGSNVQIKWI